MPAGGEPQGRFAGVTRHDAQDGLIFLAALALLPR
jgi:hypothetical protein